MVICRLSVIFSVGDRNMRSKFISHLVKHLINFMHRKELRLLGFINLVLQYSSGQMWSPNAVLVGEGSCGCNHRAPRRNGNLTSCISLVWSPAPLSLLDAVNIFQRESPGLMFRGSFPGLLLWSYSLNTLFPEWLSRAQPRTLHVQPQALRNSFQNQFW